MLERWGTHLGSPSKKADPGHRALPQTSNMYPNGLKGPQVAAKWLEATEKARASPQTRPNLCKHGFEAVSCTLTAVFAQMLDF